MEAFAKMGTDFVKNNPKMVASMAETGMKTVANNQALGKLDDDLINQGSTGSSISSLPNQLGSSTTTSSGESPLISDGSVSSGPSAGSGAETEVANNIMCKGFQELFTKNQAKYNEFLFRSLENYFTEGHTKSMLDKMLNRNMGEYIKSNQFRGIIQSEIKHSIGSIMQSTLKSELRNRKNYSGMCNEIDRLNNKQLSGGRTRTKTRNPAKKRRTSKRRN
jgi:hypothetical protein